MWGAASPRELRAAIMLLVEEQAPSPVAVEVAVGVGVAVAVASPIA